MPRSDSPPRRPLELRLPTLYPRLPPWATVDLVGSQALPLWTLPACCRPSPREPRWFPIPNPSTIDSSLRPTTRDSATPIPALAAISAGSTLTGLRRSFTCVAACRFVSVPGLRTTPPSWWSLRARWSVRFDATSYPVASGPRLLGCVGAVPRGAPFIPQVQRLPPRAIVGKARVFDVRILAFSGDRFRSFKHAIHWRQIDIT